MHTLFLNLTMILLVTRFHDLSPSKIFLCYRNTCGQHSVNNSSPDLALHISQPRTLPSYAGHVLFTYSSRDTTSFPNHTPGHLTRGPAGIHEGTPLSFSCQNITTKHHGRTIPARAEGAASSRSPSLHHHDNGFTTSIPNIYIQ
jgi:hypothetical protein